MIRALVAVWLAVWWASAATAANPYVRCVQQQLQALNYDPGPIDGIIGSRTRNAAANWSRGAPSSDADAVLNEYNAVRWCQNLGAVEPSLRRFWPSAATLQIETSTKIPALEAAGLRNVDAKARQYIERAYGAETVASYAVVTGYSLTQLRQGLRAVHPKFVAPARYKALPADTCPGGGRAYHRVIILCWLEEFVPQRSALRPAGSAAFVYVHELVHILQHQEAQNWPPKPGFEQRGLFLGPLWLVEGHAMDIASQFRRDILGMTSEQGPLPSLFSRSFEPKLQNLRFANSVDSPESYAVAMLAVEVLRNRHGPEAIFAYFRALGETGRWDAAFQDVFGESLDDFEARFDSNRADDAALLEYAGQSTGIVFGSE